MAYGTSLNEAILIAQVPNGLLLPVVAEFLLFALNQHHLMRSHANGRVSNALGIVVVGVVAVLGAWQKLLL